MTKSTITRERLEEIVSDPMINQGSEFAMMARMALAAMDSEPVAVIDPANLDYLRSGADADVWPPEREEMGDVLLYRHAQPAPVVSAELLHTAASAIEDLLATKDRMGVYVCFDLPFRLRSAANAQPAPAAPVCTCPSGDGSLRWPCPVHPGNSPVIPDGWTGNEKANAALMMLDRIETVDPVDDDRIDGIKRIVRELAAAPHDTPALNSVQSVDSVPGKWIPVSEQKPDCWCLTCRPVTLNDMRFVVCPDCGNKRCPRANDHRDACTGSNEPGQEGSVYPAAQQEVKGE
ncbi:hypothetical protein [Klebsiella pneumoniae]|uniref:hypothetical protein n=1 Tax=Klebsiella pneumoniae TaxID=573 RepID=UPI0025581145|nr:hypothetical protein [Klebsiella pneumoniae]